MDKQGHIAVSPFFKVHILKDSFPRIKRLLSQAWFKDLVIMQTQRHSLIGLPVISRTETLEILNSFNDKERKHLLREIAGAFQTGQQKKHWNETGNPTCDFCPCEDSKRHRLVECATFEENRLPFRETLQYLESEDHSMLDFPVVHIHPSEEVHQILQFREPRVIFSPLSGSYD